MSNLDQRMAEIRRRSEKILKERKKRRQVILAACIPVLLCVGIYAFMRTPVTQNHRISDPVAPEDSVGSIVLYAQAQVNGRTLSREDAQQIHVFFDKLVLPGYGFPDENDEADVRGDTDVVMSEDAEEHKFLSNSTTDTISYTITLIAEDGSSREYGLTGNELTDLATGQSVFLSQEQLQELLAFITGQQ